MPELAAVGKALRALITTRPATRTHGRRRLPDVCRIACIVGVHAHALISMFTRVSMAVGGPRKGRHSGAMHPLRGREIADSVRNGTRPQARTGLAFGTACCGYQRAVRWPRFEVGDSEDGAFWTVFLRPRKTRGHLDERPERSGTRLTVAWKEDGCLFDLTGRRSFAGIDWGGEHCQRGDAGRRDWHLSHAGRQQPRECRVRQEPQGVEGASGMGANASLAGRPRGQRDAICSRPFRCEVVGGDEPPPCWGHRSRPRDGPVRTNGWVHSGPMTRDKGPLDTDATSMRARTVCGHTGRTQYTGSMMTGPHASLARHLEGLLEVAAFVRRPTLSSMPKSRTRAWTTRLSMRRCGAAGRLAGGSTGGGRSPGPARS